MPRRSMLLVAALGIILGCRDGPTNTVALLIEETGPAELDLASALELLANPLVSELLGGLSDPSIARTLGHLKDEMATPASQNRLDEIHWTFSQVLADLKPGEADGDDEVPRAVLGLLVREAQAILDGPGNEKGH